MFFFFFGSSAAGNNDETAARRTTTATQRQRQQRQRRQLCTAPPVALTHKEIKNKKRQNQNKNELMRTLWLCLLPFFIIAVGSVRTQKIRIVDDPDDPDPPGFALQIPRSDEDGAVQHIGRRETGPWPRSSSSGEKCCATNYSPRGMKREN